MTRQLLACSLATVYLLVSSASTHSATISWNKDVFGTIPEDGSSFAGMVSAANWNNSFPAENTVDLWDDTKTPTTLDIAPSSFNVFQVQAPGPGQDTDGTYNRNLLNGYLNSGASQSPMVSSVELTQIPYAVYDIIAYFNSDVAGRTGSVSVGGTSYDFNAAGAASFGGDGNAVFLEADATTTTADAANYAVFSGLTGASQTITVNIPDFGGLAGFQVIEVPEPGSMAIGSLLGMVGLAGWLRARWG